jgi:hypothetical protein
MSAFIFARTRAVVEQHTPAAAGPAYVMCRCDMKRRDVPEYGRHVLAALDASTEDRPGQGSTPTLTACGGRPIEDPHITMHGRFCPRWCAAGHPDEERPEPPYQSKAGVTSFTPAQVSPGVKPETYLVDRLAPRREEP